MIYFTSDLHLGHAGIMKSCDRCIPFPIEAPTDPFYSEANKKQVKKSDEQFHAGRVIEKSIDELETLENR